MIERDTIHVKRRRKTGLLALLTRVLLFFLFLFALQLFWAHRGWHNRSSAEEMPIGPILSKEAFQDEDYKLLFSQTGLGKSAIDFLRGQENGGNSKILYVQDQFFEKHSVQCTPLLGWFTRVDILVNQNRVPIKGPPLISIQPGDILISRSTHSLGWIHGHAALVLDEENTLETLALGQNSIISSTDSWRKYSNYAVLRIKDATPELRMQVAEYAKNHLLGIPYRLLSGMLWDKFIEEDSRFFGAQCAYLVWYAWAEFGVDVDGDGGQMVTPMDLMLSDKVEIVQVYGMPTDRFNTAS